MRSVLAPVLVGVLLLSACATLTPEERVVLERGTPLFDRLLGAPLEGLPQQALIPAAYADRALEEGRAIVAVQHLKKAVELAGEAGPACRGRGALLYLQGLAAQLAGDARGENGWQTLAESCIEAEVPVEEEAWQRFFRFVAAEEQRGSFQQQGGETTWEAPSEVARRQWVDGMKKATARLPVGQARILGAYARWLEIQSDRPADRCDATFETRHRGDLTIAFQGLDQAGRPDLALGYFGTTTLDERAELDADGCQGFVHWLRQEGNRWVRTEAVSRALGTLRFAAEWPNAVLTAPLCDILYSDLAAAMQGDIYEGRNTRNVARLIAAFNASGACLGQQELAALVDGAFAASTADGQGRMGVLEVLGGTVVTLGVQAIDGRTDALWGALGPVLQALDRVRAGLGSSDEDRALAAVLDVVSTSPAILQGQGRVLVDAIARAADTFDGLLKTPPAAGSPELLRLLPGIRMTNLGLLSLVQYFVDEEEAARKSLERLHGTLPQDMAALLAYLEQPDHSAAILAIAGAVVDGIAELDREQPDGMKVVTALEAASTPTPDESGWWAVGLDALRVVAWDAMALLASDSDQDGLYIRALSRAEAVATRMVEGGLAQAEVSETLGSILRLLPAVHRAVPYLLDDRTEGEAAAVAVAEALEEPLAAVLKAVEGEKGGGKSVVADLVNDLLAVALEAGLPALVKEPKAALGRAVATLEARLGHYPEDIRVFLRMLAAVGRYYGAPESAPVAFAEVGDAAQEHLPAVAFVPALLEASLRMADDAPTEELLQRVDKALAHGLTALRCGQPHAVHSLLPARMWLLQADGNHAAARKAYEAYVRFVDDGFEGDIPLSCRLRSYSDSVVFSVDISSSTASFLLPGKNEGSFQVGLGTELGSDARPSGDELQCDAVYSKMPRLDRIMEAHLAFAVYAFLQQDPKAAHAALQRAIGAGRQMVYGNQVTLGRYRGAAAADSRGKLSLPMVAWAALVARLNGQGQSADILESIGEVIAGDQQKVWLEVIGPDEPIPVFFRRIPALAGFDVVMAQWQRVRSLAEQEAVGKALVAWQAKTKSVPAWGVELAVEMLVDRLPREEQKELPEGLKPSRKADEREKVHVAWRNLLVATGLQRKLPPLDEVSAVARQLIAMGLYGEVVGPLSRFALFAQRSGDLETTFKLLELIFEHVPRDQAPILYMDTLSLAADILLESDEGTKAYEALQHLLPLMDGYMSPQTEVQQLYRLLQLAGAAGEGNLVHSLVHRLRPMVGRTSGSSSAAYYTLLALDVAFQNLRGVTFDEAVYRRLHAHGAGVPGAEDTRHYLDLMRKTTSDQRKQLSEGFLIFIFQNGPRPELPEAPSGEGK